MTEEEFFAHDPAAREQQASDLSLHFFAPFLIVRMPLRILREPAAQHPLFLEEHFIDAPETAKSETADDCGKGFILYEKRKCGETQPGDQPDPPALLTEEIFHFDDSRMANTDVLFFLENAVSYP